MYKGYYSRNKYSEKAYGDLNSGEIAYPNVEPARPEQDALSVLSHMFVRLVGTDAAEASSTEFQIAATGHAALRGDVIRMTSGSYSGREFKVINTSANIIYISDKIAVSNTDTFQILRHKHPLVGADGTIPVSASLAQTPIQFDRDGVDTEVLQDTATPANSRPLPVRVFDSSGVGVNVATQTTLAALLTELQAKADLSETQPVSLASVPLPTGAATAANQSSILAQLSPSALTVKSGGITVGLTAVRLTTDGSAPSATRKLLACNTDQSVAAKFWIGPAGVTANTGLQINGGETFERLNDAGDYYIISDTAAQTVNVLEQE